MMRQIGVQPRPAAVAAAIKSRDVVVIFVGHFAVDAQVALAAEFDRRMAHIDGDVWLRPLRSRHNSAAASAAARSSPAPPFQPRTRTAIPARRR